MKRPLVLVGFCVLLTLAAAAFFGAETARVLFWICLGGFCVTVAVGKTRRAVAFPLAFASCAAAFAAFCCYDCFAVEPPRTLDGKTEAFSGTVCELPEHRDGRWHYTVRVDSLGGNVPSGFKVRLTSQNGLEAGPYSRISGKAHFFLPPGGEGFSSRGYYASKGIMMFAYPEEYSGLTVAQPVEKPPYYYALRLREKLIGAVKALLPEKEASLVNGVLLGEKGSLSQSLVDDFRADGISHLLCVSGLHMSTISQLLILVLLFFHVPKRPAVALTAAGIFGFMAVTCFVPSVTRSGIMCLLFLAAPMFSRDADPLNSLCTAGILICLQNPYSGADVGFLLSFSATLGLILCAGPITASLNKIFGRIRLLGPVVRAVDAVLGTSLAAMLFTLPVVLPEFGLLSAVAPLANVLILVPSTLLMSFGAAAAVLEILLPATYLSRPFALVAGLLARYVRSCAAWLAHLPNACISVSDGWVMLWLAGTFVLFGAALVLGSGKKLFPQAACLSVIVLLAGIFSFQIANHDVTCFTVLDAGDGISIALTRERHAAVIGCDSYSSGKIISCLQKENAGKLDCLEALTQGREEFTCASDVAARFRPVFFTAQQNSMADSFVCRAGQQSTRSIGFQSSEDMSFWNSVRVEAEASEKSCAARITVGGLTFLVCPRKFDCGKLPNSWRNPDFLITDSSEVNSLLCPAVTIFSLDRRTLGKSATDVKRCRAFWTGGYGNLVLKLKGNRVLSVGRET